MVIIFCLLCIDISTNGVNTPSGEKSKWYVKWEKCPISIRSENSPSIITKSNHSSLEGVE